MKILIIGKNGQLGKSIQKSILNKNQSNDYVFTGSQELNLNVLSDIERFFNQNAFDIVINCAAYTNVDRAEQEFELANCINNLAVQEIAKIAKIKSFKFIHISTDYVFNGELNRPYTEQDNADPINAYGLSKLNAELAINKIISNDAIIIRTSGLYSEFGNNFVNTILNLAKTKNEIDVVADQIFSPTYASDLADAILNIINNKRFNSESYKTEIYQYCSRNACSWFDFANEVLRLSNISIKVNPINLVDYPALANKPQYSALNTAKIQKDFGVKPLNWQKALKNFFRTELQTN